MQINKENYIELILSNEEMRMIEAAAKLSNVFLSSYILNITLKQARIDLVKNKSITLNNKDRDNLLDVLASNCEPSEELKRLF